MTKAMKLAKRELRKLGCRLISEGARTLHFELANGKLWVCHTGTTLATVRSVVESQRLTQRFATGEFLLRYPATSSAPILTAGDFAATTHFKSRLSLMRGQGLKYPEVVSALLAPVTVRRSPTGNLLYCAGRVAVVVDPGGGVFRLVTVLWATDELWAANPRPEVEAA